MTGLVGIAVLAGFAFILIMKGVNVLREFERGVLLRLGRYVSVRGPGLIWIIPFIDELVRVDLRTLARDVPPQDVITRDNVSVKVNAVLYYRVVAPEKAILEVENFIYATNQLAQTTLRSVLGQVELDDLLAERDKINEQLQEILDRHTEPWGIKISMVEVKHIDLPPDMQRAMARQAEAERERRAKVIAADGELQASGKLAEAAQTMSEHPMSAQLRFLQTLTEVASERNSTIVFPVPIDLFTPFLERHRERHQAKSGE
jgi:regulator of protease activity HflC (stomatin/prohibitin superfamily)